MSCAYVPTYTGEGGGVCGRRRSRRRRRGEEERGGKAPGCLVDEGEKKPRCKSEKGLGPEYQRGATQTPPPRFKEEEITLQSGELSSEAQRQRVLSSTDVPEAVPPWTLDQKKKKRLSLCASFSTSWSRIHTWSSANKTCASM